MRIEVACNRLISASLDRNVKADYLAKTIMDAIEKVREQSPKGEEALDKLHDGFLREALKRDVNINKLMSLKNEAAAAKKSAKVVKKKTVARKVAAKATSKTKTKAKPLKAKARPKSNASENRDAA